MPGSLESVNVEIPSYNNPSDSGITASTSDGYNTYADVHSSGDIKLDIKVEGDVGTAETAETPASGNGITLKNSSFSDGEGASAATTEVTIIADGNVNSIASSGGTLGPTANGIEAKSEVVYNSKDTIISNVTVEGNVSASAGDPEDIDLVNGVNVSAVNYGTGSAVTNVVVNGDNGITAVGGEETRGIYADADSDAAGSVEINVAVNGINGVIAEADSGIAYGIFAVAGHDEEYDNSETNKLEEVEDNAQRKVKVQVANGGVTVTGNSAVGIDGKISGSAEFFVNQNVDVLAKGDGQAATGIQIDAYGENTDVKLDIGGVVASETGKNGAAIGAFLTARDGALLNAAVGNDGITATGAYATGINTIASGNGTEVNIAVNGITANSDASHTATGAFLYAEKNATVTAVVGESGIIADGGAEITSGSGDVGAALCIGDGASVSLDVAGDVIAKNGTGIELETRHNLPSTDKEEPDPGTINVFIEGTVSGGKESFLLNSGDLESSNVSLTVWSATENENGNILGTLDYDNVRKSLTEEIEEAKAQGDEEMVKNLEQQLANVDKIEKAAIENAAEIEKNIQYIIRVEKESNGGYKEYEGLSFGNALAVSNGYYAATEATDVTLKALDGYDVISIVDSENGANTFVTKDENGVYHILIPKGGGVWLNVKVEKIPEPSDDSSSVEFVLMALGRIIAKDGSVLTIYNNRTYTVAYADGSNDNGTWRIADSLLFFTNSAGEEIAPERNADGNAVYTFKAGTEFVITPDIVNAVQAYRMF